MGTYSKAANQARRLPDEIERLKRNGREDEAKRAQEHLERAKALLASRARK